MISKIWYGVIGLLLVFTLVACELFTEGYGDKVDLSAPTLQITTSSSSTENASYASGILKFECTVTDDIAVDRVEIKYTSKSNVEEVIKAVLEDKLWKASIDTVAKFTDKSVSFTVTAYDTAGKSTEKIVSKIVDNTPPTVLVISPGNYAGNASYNGVVEFKGLAGDDNQVISVEMSFKSVSDNTDLVPEGEAKVDGTLEWSKKVDTSSTNGNYYIEVTATDIALNKNTYFFHTSDLPSKNSAFGYNPTFEDLKKDENIETFKDIRKDTTTQVVFNIDQNSDKPTITIYNWELDANVSNDFTNNISLTGQITDDDTVESVTVTIKEKNPDGETYTTVKEAVTNPSVPVYNLNIDLEDSSWDNFTSTDAKYDGVVIGKGSYIVTITAKDLNDDPDKYGTLDLLLGIDKENPVVQITSPTSDHIFKSDTLTVTGIATDDTKVKELYLTVNGTKDTEAITPGSDGSWSKDIYTSGVAGKYTIKAEVYDVSGKTSYVETSIIKDTDKPVIKNIIGVTGELNGIITIYVDVVESNLTSTVFSIEKKENPQEIIILGEGTLDGITRSITLDTTKYSYGDKFIVTATDEAGNVSTYPSELKIDQTTDDPIISISNWDLANVNYYSENIILSGLITDDDKISNVKIKVTEEDKTTVVKEAEISPNSSSYRLNINLEQKLWSGFTFTQDSYKDVSLSSGNYYIYIYVEDNNTEAKKEQEAVVLAIDKSSPEIGSIISPADESFFNSEKLIVNGTASDDLELTSVKLYANDVEQVSPVTLNADGTWSGEITTPDSSGKVTIRAVATDVIGKTGSKEIIVHKDLESPVFKNISGVTGNLNGVVTFSGSTTESNFKDVIFEFKGDVIPSDNVTVNSDQEWVVTLDTTGYVDGTYEFKATATDLAGNSTDYSTNVTLLQSSDNPVITFKTPASDVAITENSYSGSLNIWFELSDDDVILSSSKLASSIDIEIVNTSTGVAKVLDRSNIIIEDSVSTDDLNDPVTVKYNPSGSFALEDGEYDITVTIQDDKTTPGVNGTKNISVSKSASFIMDSQGPSVTVDSAFDSLRHVNNNFDFKGKSEDTIGSVSEVIVVIDDSSSTTTHVLNVGNGGLDTDGNWSHTVDTSAVSTGEEKSFTISVEARDNAGNSSGVQSKNVVVDKADPIEEATLSSSTVDLNGVVSIKGAITESYLEDIQLQIGSGDWFSLDPSKVKHSWEYEVDTRDNSIFTTGDGVYNFSVRGVDKAGNNAETKYSLTIDQSKDLPTFKFDNPLDKDLGKSNNQFTQSGKFSGRISDDDGVDSSSIRVNFYDELGNTVLENHIPTTSASGKTVEWSVDLDNGGTPLISQGVFNFEVVANDDINEKLTGDAAVSSTSSRVEIAVDNGDPTITVNSPANGTTEINYVNNDLTISGVASDGFKIDQVDYSMDDGTTWINIVDEQNLTDVNWTKTFTLAEMQAVSTSFNVIVRATDNAGKSSQQSLSVVIDTDGPLLVVNSPVDNELTDKQNFEISGTAKDFSVGIKSVQYSIDGGAYQDLTLTGIDWAKTLDLGTTEGNKVIEFRALDKLDNTTTLGPYTLRYDLAEPTLTASGAVTQVITKDNFIVAGTALDSNALTSLKVYVNGGSETEITVAGDNTWSYTQPNTADGVFNLKFVATDAANRTVELERNVVIDATSPVTPFIEDIAGSYVTNNLSIAGMTSDVTSQIEAVYYSVDYTDDGNNANDTWTMLNGTDNWFMNIDVSTFDQGDNTIFVRSVDKAGNESLVASKSYIIDRADPVTSIIGYEGATYKNSDFTISGTVSDNLGFAGTPLTISVTRDGNDVTLTEGVNFGAQAGTTAEPRSWSQLVPGSDNGVYTIEITAKDNVGRTSVVTKVVTVDRSAPSLSGISLSDGNKVLNSSLTITGAAADVGVSGLALVEYSRDNLSWLSAAGTSSWSIGLSGLTDSLTEKLYIRVKDNAGNTSPVTEISFVVDTAKPETSILGVGTSFSYVNSDLTLSGIASDGNGIKSLVVNSSKDGGSTASLPFTLDAGDNSWSINTPLTADGVYDLEIVVTDNADQVTTYTRRVGIDKTQPTLNITSPSVNENVKNSGYTIRGTVTDGDGNGIKTLDYSTDGSNWLPVIVSYSWSVENLDFTGTDGSRTLYVRANDGLNTPVTKTVSFYHDNNAPSLTETGIGSSYQEYKRVDFSIEGEASDTVAIKEVRVTATKNGAADTLNLVDTNLADGYKFDITLPADSSLDGDWVYTITASDNAGNENTLVRKIIIDKTAPEAPVITTAANQYFETILNIDGTAADSGSDISKVQYSFNGTEWFELTGTNNWLGNIDISSVSEGLNAISVIAIDKAGNETAVPVVFTYFKDVNAPTVTVGGTWGTTEYKTTAFSITGTASDQVNLTSLVVNATGATVSANKGTNASWNYDITPTEAGIQTITITAMDEKGNQTVKTAKFFYDKEDPTLSNISLTNGESVGESKLTITGTATDGAGDSGVALVEYKLNSDAWKNVNGTDAWNISLTGLVDQLGQTIQFRVTDRAGKTVTGSTITFDVDSSVPEIASEIYADRAFPYDFADEEIVTTNMAFGGNSAQFAMKFLVKDSIGIASVALDVPGYGSVINGSDTSTDQTGYDVWTTPTIDTSVLTDGTQEWTITVTDKAGQTTTAKRTVLMDNTAPSLTYQSPRHLTDTVNGEVEVKGLAEDSGSGLSKVEYKIGYNYMTETWAATSGSTFNWEVPFTGTNKIDIYAGRAVESIDLGTNTVTFTAHGYAENTMVWVGGDEVPGGLSHLADYYVVNVTTDTFQLANASGGGVADITTTGSDFRVSKYSKDSDNNNIWELPILVRATDQAGNGSITNTTGYIVLVDPSGDKPNAEIIYPAPEDTNRVMGGIIRVFGTATDDDAVDSVYMQIDANANGDWTDDTNVDGTDWSNGGLGQKVNGTVSWNYSINTNGEFNPTGDGTNTIYFRVRVKDTYGLYGPWSSAQQIDVDKNVPKIGSSEAITLTNGGAVQSYVADMWIKDDWVLKGTIEDESGISSIEVSGDINGTLASNPEWFTTFTGSGSSGYRMQIPVSTTANSSGGINFTVKAYDNSDPQQNSSATYSINYDNKAPTLTAYAGNIPVEQSNKTYQLTSTVNEDGAGLERVAFYFLRKGGSTDPNDRVYNPMESKTGNANRTYTSSLDMTGDLPRLAITGATRPDVYSLTHSLIENNNNVRVGGVIEVGGLDHVITAVDYGNGTVTWSGTVDTSVTSAKVAYALIVDNNKIETPVWDGSTLQSIINDDGDGLIEAIERSGGAYDWFASLNSHNIPDGPIEIHWVAFDKAGNSASDSVSTQVLNNRPKLAKVILGTDLDGNGTVAASEKEPEISLLDGSGNEQAEVTASTASFIAKDKTTIELDVVGGNGQLQYELKHGLTDLHSGLNNLRTDESASIEAITITTANFGTTGEGSQTLTVKIWDTTEETTPGTDSQWAEITLPLTVDVVDEVAPTANITPFYWNSESDNSLYNNSRDNGHIELGLTALGDDDPKVSGQISIKGTSYDNQRLTGLWVYIDGFTFTGATAFDNGFDINADGSDETLVRTYAKVATYANGSWSAEDKWSTNGWKFSIVSNTLDQSGHTVEWQLDWDSSKVTGFAALDREIRAISEDKRSNPNASSESLYKVDVVPYITGVNSSLSNAYASEASVFNRSALGYYPLRENETVVVKGFNFAGASGTSITVDGNSLSGLSDTSEGISGSLPNNTNSGEILLTVNSISSINNLTDNTKDYNKEANGVNNNILTDDRYAYVWDFSEVVSNSTIRFPKMDISKSASQEVGFIYDSGAQYVRMNIDGSDFQVDQSYTQWYDTAFAMDSSGRAYGASMNGDSGASGDQSNGSYANFKYYAWNTQSSPGTNSTSNTSAYRSGSKSQAIENAFNGTIFSSNRVLNPEMYTVLDGSTQRIFMTYYESSADEIRFRAGTVSGSSANPNFGGALINHDNKNNGSAADFHAVSDSSSGLKPGQYSTVAAYVDPTDGLIAALLWYDATSRSLVYSWNDNPTGNTATAWQTNATVIDSDFAGWYVDMDFDTDGGVHIAYYNSSGGDLKYAYLNSYKGTPETVTVDSFLSTGENISITTKKVGANQVPYISYYMGSYTSTSYSIRTAWRSDFTSLNNGAVSDKYTGSWEVMTIPTVNNPKKYDVGIGIKNDSPMLGYATDINIETAVLR